MKINNAILTGKVEAGPKGLVFHKDTFTGPLSIPLKPGLSLADDQKTLLQKGGQLLLTGRLAMLKQTHHVYPKGALEAAMAKAAAGELAGAETVRKGLQLGLAEAFTVELAVDEVKPMSMELLNKVEMVAEIFEFGAEQARFTYSYKKTGNRYTNAHKYNLKQAVQPRQGDDPSQVMRFRAYSNHPGAIKALADGDRSRFHIEGRILAIVYSIRVQPETVHALVRRESLDAAGYESLAKAYAEKALHIEGAALDIEKASRMTGSETFYFDLPEVSLPHSVKTERGFEIVKL